MTGLTSILSLVLIILIITIVVLIIIYLMINVNESNQKKTKNNTSISAPQKIAKSYEIESVFNFMEFDKIEDNMIIQKQGKRFLMVVECQGINYDLMSEIEKNSVESGFIQFLNTLRNPIQIYVQTRTINLENSLQSYRNRLQRVEKELTEKENRYKQMTEAPERYAEEEIALQNSEMMRQRNLYEYGKDIIFNTEKMSSNKNVLRKKYYVIFSYYQNETEDEDGLKESELKDMAFSELYTNCQSAIRALYISGVTGKIMNSYELVDLLYNTYNRDEAENYGAEKAYKGGFNELYITAEDVLDKKMQAIDEMIKNQGLNLAKHVVEEAKSEKQKKVEEKISNVNKLIEEMAEIIIEENRQYLGDEISEEAIKKVNKNVEQKGEKRNGKANKKRV